MSLRASRLSNLTTTHTNTTMTAEQPELAIEDQPKVDAAPVEGQFDLKESELVDPVTDEKTAEKTTEEPAVDGKFDLKENEIVDPVDVVDKGEEPAVDGKFDLKEDQIVDPVDVVKKRGADEPAAAPAKKKKLAGKKSKKYDSEPEEEDEDELPEEEDDLEDELDVLEDDEGEEVSLDDIPPVTSRRNRKPVDYVAANKALEEEERMSREASGLPEVEVVEEEDYVVGEDEEEE